MFLQQFERELRIALREGAAAVAVLLNAFDDREAQAFAGNDVPNGELTLGVGDVAPFFHQLGSALQFEDRIGVGFRFGTGHALGLRAIHYSNAGFKQPNDGIEAYSLYYQLRY